MEYVLDRLTKLYHLFSKGNTDMLWKRFRFFLLHNGDAHYEVEPKGKKRGYSKHPWADIEAREEIDWEDALKVVWDVVASEGHISDKDIDGEKSHRSKANVAGNINRLHWEIFFSWEE